MTRPVPRPERPSPPRRGSHLRVVPAKDSTRVGNLQRAFGLTQAEMARILETSASTLARRPLAAAELDRLAILEQLEDLAAQIVPRAHLPRWIAESKSALEGAAPKDLLASESGRRALETYLLRALDGTAL